MILAPTLAGAADLAPVAIPRPTEKALRYDRTGNILWCFDQVWALAIPAVILATGLSVRLRSIAARMGRHRLFFTAGAFALLYLGLTALVSLPLDYYQGFLRPHAYGLSNQTTARWLDHRVKGFLVNGAIEAMVAGVVFLVIRRSPKRWWLYVGLMTVPFALFSAFVRPVFVDPLFNRFGTMRDPALESRILALADRVGVSGARVFEVDMSRDTKALNAYVTGLLGTKRIVLWDTLTDRLDPDQVEFVMAHELGHYAMNHVVQGLVVSSALTIVGLALMRRLAMAALGHWRHRLGFDRLDDVASVPLLLICGHVVALALIPFGYTFSRHMEHEADRFALELTHANHAGATSFVVMQEENLSNPRPGPFHRIWRSTHPSLAERITFCNTYHPWREDPYRP